MLNEIGVAVYASLASIWSAFLVSVPGIVAAVIILVIGFIIGKLFGAGVREVLLKFNVDKHVKIKQEELKLSNIFSEIIKWVLYLLFISQAAQTMGITLIADAMFSVMIFLPHVLAAIIIVAVGYVIARYVEDIVRDSKFAYSGIMSKVFFFFIVYLSIAIGLNSLNPGSTTIIDTTLINNIMLIIVGSAGLGFAIAMGLGLKDMFREVGEELGKKMVVSLKKSDASIKRGR